MKSVCLFFQIHQPFRLRQYRFFDIGNDHYYFDDFANDDIISRIAEQSYLPMLRTLEEMINASNKTFHCSISVSGVALEQLQLCVPEFKDELSKLIATGCVELLSEPYDHSLASLEDPEEFIRQVKGHSDLLYRDFGVRPTVFKNTELIYDDDIASVVAAMGFKACLTVGAKHILGWKSPDYVYAAASAPELKLLLTNEKLTSDVARNFANTAWDEYPLTADKYIDWIAALPAEEQVINLYFSMDTFGTFLPAETGIFNFLKALPRFAAEKGVRFVKPSDVLPRLAPVDVISVPFPMSGVDEARDVSAWKGNDLQREALEKLYSVAERVNQCEDRRLRQDWHRLQASDHFYYMSTKTTADGAAHALFSPYASPFDAFTNYMNCLADLMVRVEEQYPAGIENEELNSLLLTIRNQSAEIESLKKEVKTLHDAPAADQVEAADPAPVVEAQAEPKAAKPKAKAAPKKSAAKKPASKAKK